MLKLCIRSWLKDEDLYLLLNLDFFVLLRFRFLDLCRGPNQGHVAWLTYPWNLYMSLTKDYACGMMDWQVMFPSSLVHQVPEGHVGAYWRGGALLNIITEPGITDLSPFPSFVFFCCFFFRFGKTVYCFRFSSQVAFHNQLRACSSYSPNRSSKSYSIKKSWDVFKLRLFLFSFLLSDSLCLRLRIYHVVPKEVLWSPLRR